MKIPMSFETQLDKAVEKDRTEGGVYAEQGGGSEKSLFVPVYDPEHPDPRLRDGYVMMPNCEQRGWKWWI